MEASLLGTAGGRATDVGAHPSCKGSLHGRGLSYEGAGATSAQSTHGQPGQAKWEMGSAAERTGVRAAADILSAGDASGDTSEWAGKGGGPERASGGRPGQRKWHIGNAAISGGDFVGVRPVSDISDLVFESEGWRMSAGGDGGDKHFAQKGDLVAADTIYGIDAPW
jgi:hypothetical protein